MFTSDHRMCSCVEGTEKAACYKFMTWLDKNVYISLLVSDWKFGMEYAHYTMKIMLTVNFCVLLL
jgi:hypothetical protein